MTAVEVGEGSGRPRQLGPYRLGLRLGAGGMGEVYKAFDDRLGRWVAAKRLRGDATAEARARFRREARVLARLGHPAIVQIFDIVEDESGDWIVMELVEGSTLAELGAGGPLDVGLVLDFGRQVAAALGVAHAAGIVHRDLKTENVMVLPSGHAAPGRIKVLDFGLARGVSSVGGIRLDATVGARAAIDLLSAPGRVAGTPRAMSPEQAAGGEVDARADLFSLGVLLYEISTARSPFAARAVEEILHRVSHHRPPPMRRLHPRVPSALSALVDRLLEKDPDRRPGSAAAVADELVAIAASDPTYRVGARDLSKLATATSVDPGPSTAASGAGVLTAAAATAAVTPDAVRDDAVVATLLASDLVDGGVDGAPPAGELRSRHDRWVRELLEEHGGERIDPGAGFERLLLFDRPWSAVSYALAYHRYLRRLALTARVGIHLGETILLRDASGDATRGTRSVELEGPAAPSVSRLASLAAGGQTLLTRAAYEMARRSAASEADGEVAWRAHGRYRFAEAGAEVEVFEVGVSGTAPLVAPAGSPGVVRLAPPWSATAPVSLRPVPGPRPVTLRVWPPPDLPEHPYPVLLPYSHPDFMAGRDQEIARLRRLLQMPVPILGLSAPSGVGKSSLLLGALVPILRAAGVPVAVIRHPAEPGVASRLISDLLDGAEPVDDRDAAGFVERLAEVERLVGTAPILVLDQFEDVLRDQSSVPRATLGLLMAASAARRPGLAAPPCRWLIAYRQELYGRLNLWLGDVLADARTAGVGGLEGLSHDLCGVERFHAMTLAPLATPSTAAAEPLDEATGVFRLAIEKPFTKGGLGEIFPPGHAQRLARAFAEARLARPDAPLAPELQVALAHLLAEAGAGGRVAVPEDPGPLIDRALEDHLRRALEAAFPEGTHRRTRRARVLLALRALATDAGRRGQGLRTAELARAIGREDQPREGEEILEALATPLTRLVVVREADDGPRWVLAHDRMAEAVVRLVAEEGRRGELLLDVELLELRRFVSLRTALYRSGEVEAATRVPRRRFRRIREHAGALLWDGDARAWFDACGQRRRADRRRFGTLAAVVALFLALVGLGAWSWSRRTAEQQALREQVVDGEPEVAFRALDELATRPDAEPAQLLALLRQRDTPMDVLESGLGGLDDTQRSAAVLRAVDVAMPWVEETPRDPRLIANLVWALDYAPGRDPAFAERARAARDRVLAALRRRWRPPPLPEPSDPDWIQVPAGSFLMGTAPGEEGEDRERPQHEVTVSTFRMLRHEVTNAEYRRLVPGHHPGAGDDLPALNVNWYAAYTYAAWLGARLPTEAEWEYAARADCPHAYCARDGTATTADVVAWTRRNSRHAVTGEPGPRPIMLLEPNSWGLFDMLGNSHEWVVDWSGDYPADPQRDPWGPAGADIRGRRIHRGGSFFNTQRLSRVTQRAGNVPGYEFVYLGFRVVIPGSEITTRKPKVPGR